MVGVKFRSSVGGFITGFRFYEPDEHRDAHGRLWTFDTRLSTQTLLGTAVQQRAPQDGSGWTSHVPPVAINAFTA